MHLTANGAKFHHPTFNRLEVIVLANKLTNKQAGWFVRPDCAPSSKRPHFRMPPVRIAPEFPCLHAAAPPVQSEYPAERRAAAAVPLPESPWRPTSKSISSVSFVRIESNLFCDTQETDAKMMDQNFEIRIL